MVVSSNAILYPTEEQIHRMLAGASPVKMTGLKTAAVKSYSNAPSFS